VAQPSPAAHDKTKPAMIASSSDAGVTTLTGTKAEQPSPAKAVPAVKHEPTPKPVRTASVEQGSLSVYFLGGVGDVWVDDRLFSQQPPFEKAPLAAGKHRVSCRMSDDKESHEITVNIRSGHETVIEYEVGGKPVVSEE
jgi:hypothetical protein